MDGLFVVPNQDSTSYGYLYNNTITSKEEATYNMMELFDVEPDGEFSFNNYIAKSVWKGERTILNGNMLALRTIRGYFWTFIYGDCINCLEKYYT